MQKRLTRYGNSKDWLVDKTDINQATLRPEPPAPTVGFVTYEVHLHPTYQVPCLWFSLHGLPPDEPAFSIDTVFRRLVPDQFKDGLRGLAGIGGISADVSRQVLQSLSIRISQNGRVQANTKNFLSSTIQ